MTSTILTAAEAAVDADFLHDLMTQALRAGASDAQVDGRASRSLSLEVRDGQFQDIHQDDGASVHLTTYIGKRQAKLSTNKVGRYDIAELVGRVIKMTELATEDPYCGLAPSELIASPGNDAFLDLVDPSEPSPAMLQAWAVEVEQAARSVTGVTASDSASAGWNTSTARSINSAGLDRRADGTSFGVGVSVMAGTGDDRELGNAGRGAHWRADLPALDEIGREAGEEAVGKLGARKIASCRAPVIFDRRIAMAFIGPLVSAISGGNIARGTSFLKDGLGEAIFPHAITLVDDAFVVRGHGSRACDGEGIVPKRRALIDQGVLTTWLLDLAAARELGLASTGHAGGPSNLTLLPGERDQAGLIADAGMGLLVDNLFGPSLNPHTGDWSVGVSGKWFEGGAVAYPVSEVTIAGNLRDLYRELVAGSDLELRGAANAPSLLVPQMAIGGQ